MLIRRKSEAVISSYVPAPGEEIYDTILGATYLGDGYKAVSALTAVVTSSDPDELFYFLPDFMLVSGGGSFVSEGSATFDVDVLTSIAIAPVFPDSWTTFDVYISQNGDGDEAVILTTYLPDDSGTPQSKTITVSSSAVVEVKVTDTPITVDRETAYQYGFAKLQIGRDGTDVADTSADTMNITRIRLVKVS